MSVFCSYFYFLFFFKAKKSCTTLRQHASNTQSKFKRRTRSSNITPTFFKGDFF